jgi:acyl carrier protein
MMQTADNIPDHLRTLMAARLRAQEADIVREASLIDDLGADSLDLVGLIMEIEDDFDIDIPDEDAAQIVTVKQLVEYVEFAAAAKDTGRSRQVVIPQRTAAGRF